jgi:hypothetical protein
VCDHLLNYNFNFIWYKNLALFLFSRKIQYRGMVAHVCNPSQLELEIGGLLFKTSLGKKVTETLSQKKKAGAGAWLSHAIILLLSSRLAQPKS